MTPILHRRTTARRDCGFTSLELLIVLAVVGILSSIAYPTFAAQLARARRSDALVALMAAQMAEERWRANRPSYANLADIGVAGVSSAGHYTLQVTGVSASGYQILASARGSQRRDGACRNLRLGAAGANLVYASGPDENVGNPAALNRQCWSL